MPCFTLKDGTRLNLKEDALKNPEFVEFLKENAAPEGTESTPLSPEAEKAFKELLKRSGLRV